jgi:thiosulfate/3-mercaptopyruvate sulfurtransferase
MLSTFYGTDRLDTAAAFGAALVLGVFFGLALERAGFGSSRRLAAVFYLEDMAVVKVMFSALITAMLGLILFTASGLLPPEQLYYLPTVYGAHLAGGLLFGVGFAMGGWCPGTAAVGAASGKLDALIFLGGGMVGAILFNEAFPLIQPLSTWGEAGVVFIYQTLGLGLGGVAFLLALMAVAAFWGCEILERRRGVGGVFLVGRFLPSFSLAVLAVAAVAYVAAPLPGETPGPVAAHTGEAALLSQVEAGQDHMEPEELADRLLAGTPGLVVADVRSEAQYRAYHLRGAIHAPLSRLGEVLTPYKNQGVIVLYSGGMTHAAQARDSLARQGFANVYLLTDGLRGFRERVLKPVSLREEPMSPATAARINAWRAFFGAAAPGPAPGSPDPAATELPASLPGLVDTGWLAQHLGKPWLKIIDLRSQPEYNSGHIPGALYLNVESLRGVVGGVSSMLLPAELLAGHFALMGITPGNLVVFAPGDKWHDATLAGMAAERLGHRRYALLQGGMARWLEEKRPLNTALPVVKPSRYPVIPGADDFTVDAAFVLKASRQGKPLILDTRPAEYFSGKKSDEARAGHIPGALNRPYTEDVLKDDRGVGFKPLPELAAAYARLLPDKESPVIVHCRTGHQASQTFFVLKRLLGYKNVKYYDAGWSEWASRPELPVAAAGK